MDWRRARGGELGAALRIIVNIGINLCMLFNVNIDVLLVLIRVCVNIDANIDIVMIYSK